MKWIKATAVLLCMCLLGSLMAIGISADTINLCAVFQRDIPSFLIWKQIINDGIKGKMLYIAVHIPSRDDYRVELPNHDGYYYSYPADIFEQWATKFFNIEIDDMRKISQPSGYISTEYYNAAQNTYDFIGGGMGGGFAYTIHGYTENQSKIYNVYVKSYDWQFEPCRSVEELYAEIDDFEEHVKNGFYTGEVIELSGYYYPVTGYYQVDVTFDGSYTKYLKSTTLETIPKIDNIITPHAKGDINHDGSVNAADALLILKAAVGKTQLDAAQAIASDLNADGKINAQDALMILKIAVGKA